MSYTKVRNYSDDELLKRVKSLKNYNGIPSDYWILGVRSKADTLDIFDDKFYLFKGEKFILVTTGTTNPGKSILQGGWKRFNKDGAFVIKSDYWQYNLWKNGLHLGKMPALIQLGAPVVGYRDNNNNDKSEEIGNVVRGWYGVNFHFNNWDVAPNKIFNPLFKVIHWMIGGWSAGCQVCNNPQDYMRIINACKNQATITYCVLNEF